MSHQPLVQSSDVGKNYTIRAVQVAGYLNACDQRKRNKERERERERKKEREGSLGVRRSM